MKRLYIVLTILLSSFLLLSGREVKADSKNFVTDIDLSLINDEFFEFKERVDSFISETSDASPYYFIIHDPSAYHGLAAYVVKSSNNPSPPFSLYIYVENNDSNVSFFTDPAFSYYQVYLGYSSNFNARRIYLFNPKVSLLYSSFDFHLNSDESITFNYNNESFVTDSTSEDKYFSVYDVYMSLQSEPEPVDNTPQLTTFYTFVLAKIAYFCNYMATNTLFLTMLVIIILIFIFELIFRRRL